MGIRSDGTYESTVRIHPSNTHIYPLFHEQRRLYDIGECNDDIIDNAT